MNATYVMQATNVFLGFHKLLAFPFMEFLKCTRINILFFYYYDAYF